MFASDYSYWILFESSGKLRLNRVARDILNRYVPFSPQLRTELQKHPILKESMDSFEAKKEDSFRESKKIQPLLPSRKRSSGGFRNNSIF
ncbi:hypothetical protein LEP1GSC124_0391 [Leptospira interrogans serovar Pyrogenes str. 200701872]|uniref:Uncharacterized protein n=1 Tax=Leptospira interrogans serovar Pyrogenes str. 200701872 TaxID=1193029 RepID=M6ZS07_LEPIR|nr:hypothetical protein LEP1GSC124_0391 [Leptospira interrogans serovar Pyrogenes str. 200701872]